MTNPLRLRLLLLLLALTLAAACDAGGGSAPDTTADTATAADTVPDTAAVPDTDTAADTVTVPDTAPDAVADAAPDIAPDAPSPPPGPQPRCVEGDFLPYHGVLHAHSTISDGAGPPEEAFAHARDEAGLDIMVLTDHMEVLVGPTDELAACRAIADDFYEPGVYLTDCGYEFATSIVGRWGHNNVYFAPDLFRLTLEFGDFYADLADCETCVAQFNHPRDKTDQHWFDFTYDAPADETLNLMEFNTGADAWAVYHEALTAGWHVSPTVNQDNHDADWGTKDDRRTGFWMADLTREALRDAMLDRRSFMSEDANATIRAAARPADGPDADARCWMGSILTGLTAFDLVVEVADPDGGESFDHVEVHGPGPTLLETVPCDGAAPCVAEVTVAVEAAGFVVARAVQADGDVLVAAPVWFAP